MHILYSSFYILCFLICILISIESLLLWVTLIYLSLLLSAIYQFLECHWFLFYSPSYTFKPIHSLLFYFSNYMFTFSDWSYLILIFCLIFSDTNIVLSIFIYATLSFYSATLVIVITSSPYIITNLIVYFIFSYLTLSIIIIVSTTTKLFLSTWTQQNVSYPKIFAVLY